MDLTLEAYHNIVGHIGNRSEIASLCRVSKAFQRAAEQALYNTIFLDDTHDIYALCVTLTGSPRLAFLVESLTISPDDDEDDYSDNDYDGGHHDDGSGEGGGGGRPGGRRMQQEFPQDYWSWVFKALQNTKRLRYLDIRSHIGPTSTCAWIYPKEPVFLLHTLFCDFDWDADLVTFLNSQRDLEDLYILDFKSHISIPSPTLRLSPPPINTNETTTMATTAAGETQSLSPPTPIIMLHETAMPKLMTLECTFSEAADAILPYRPITHLKTCFSRTEISAKREEMRRLISSISLSTRGLRSLDIADSSYSEDFAMELLRAVVGSAVIVNAQLRYLGTLVLPVGGHERLQFYGLLMRLPWIACLEMEVSEWDPMPSTPAAFKALANELRIYCPSVTTVVFVHDFDRTVVNAVKGVCSVENDPYTEHLWREF